MSLQRSKLESTLMRIWMGRGPLTWILRPVSAFFHLAVTLRRRLFQAGILKKTRLPVPVIVVGNIFVGGTGKTPLTIWLVEKLRQAGYRPGVISRGYGTRNDVPRAVFADSAPEDVGDEPVLIARRAGCPVMVGAGRVAAGEALLASHPEVNLIISDDGLQHYALARDIEIVLCDERGNGNGLVFPAGPLREPPARPRDFTVVNGARIPTGVPDDTVRMQLAGEFAEQLTDRAQAIPLTALSKSAGDRSRRIVAAAGIGNPGRFFGMLRQAGLTVEEMPLPDHYDFAGNPFSAVQADIILITEKDAVKCVRSDTLRNDPRLWVVPVTARIDDALAQKILEKCRGRPIA